MTAPVAHGAPRFVDNGEVRIAVYEQGNADGPTVVMVHGWPDSHVLWTNVVPLLADRFRVVSYDNRGVGGSSAPAPVRAYTMAEFAGDFAAVIDAVSPGQPVHVLAHDWGSVAVWEYLKRSEAANRVASFTSTSGPSVDHLVADILDRLKRPYRLPGFTRALGQCLRLGYQLAFSIPVLSPALVRAAFSPRRLQRVLAAMDGIPAEQVHHLPTVAADAANSLKIYRANSGRAMGGYRRDHFVDVPVQIICATNDPVLRPHSFDGESQWTRRLWRRDINAGHWTAFSHPRVLAAAVAELADVLGGQPPSRAMLRAQVGRTRGPFGDMLVSVTGAGSGIGRATAVEFARQGAEVVVSDVDATTADETARLITAAGGVAHPYALDVADADAVEAFAGQVCATHGVPDVVVNNAGIGQAGGFIDTPAEQFDRVIDINLGGVVNGCRAFARRLVERGTGGHIVNVASAAAFSPLQQLNAYCTSKAAVFMFSDCLRAELDSAGVGVTTICPGPVHTNIVAAAQFNAPDSGGAQVHQRRQQWDKFFEMRRYSPEKAAKAIVSAVRKNKPIRPVTPEAYLLYGTARVLPQALRSAARSKAI